MVLGGAGRRVTLERGGRRGTGEVKSSSSYNKAIHKKSVSCPAGGCNCGHSGNGNFLFSHFFFGLVGKY